MQKMRLVRGLDSVVDNRKFKIQNRKLVGILALVVAFVASGTVAQAQQTGKVLRIGYLDGSTASGSAVLIDAFRQELSKLGWTEGKTIPIVMTRTGDPLALGLVASLARPGGNVTGLSSLNPELNTKRLEVLKDAVPNLVRVGLLRPARSPGSADLPGVNELRAAATALKLKLEEIDTQPAAKGLESAFQTAKEKQVNAIMTGGGPSFFAERKRIVNLAAKHRLPAIYFQKEFVDEGGLMSYGADYNDLYRRAAGYVDKILKGAKPAELPVQQATKFEFIVNLKAAKQIGLTIPINLLERANKVIK